MVPATAQDHTGTTAETLIKTMEHARKGCMTRPGSMYRLKVFCNRTGSGNITLSTKVHGTAGPATILTSSPANVVYEWILFSTGDNTQRYVITVNGAYVMTGSRTYGFSTYDNYSIDFYATLATDTDHLHIDAMQLWSTEPAYQV